MTPSRRVWSSALRLTFFLILGAAAPSVAQTYGDYLPGHDVAPDPLARSPRLAGMGRLLYTVDDPYHQISLWDFALNPTGIQDDDSVSTIQLRPAGTSATASHVQYGPTTAFERQDFAMSTARLGFEMWHRHPGATTYGLIGELGGVSFDRPYSADTEQRSHFSIPNATLIVNGKMPYLASEHMKYALRLSTAYVSQTERYRSFVTNAAGQFLDQSGELGDPPNYFIPDETSVQRLGTGVAFSYDFGAPLVAAAGVDLIQNKIRGDNEGGRYASEQDEDRPFTVGQLSLVGHAGTAFDWGLDGRTYKASSDARWVFTISAGVGGVPLDGRGRLYHREETGSEVRGRLHWRLGSLDLGAGGFARTQRIELSAPAVDDPESFNHFRNIIVNTADADSIALPDSVVDNTSKLTGWEAGGGAAYHLPWRSAILAAEYHMSHSLYNQDLGGDGPKARDWNARVGLEVPMTTTLTLRGGYVYRWGDRDELIAQNEYIGSTMTLGLGLRPSVRWSVELAYSVDWFQADYGDPTTPDGGGQQLAAGVHWSF